MSLISRKLTMKNSSIAVNDVVKQNTMTVLADYCGVHLSEAVLASFVDSFSRRFAAEVAEDHLDTLTREDLVSNFSCFAIGKSWPMYGDSEGYKAEFYSDLSDWCSRNNCAFEP
jgi:hypothetical protein